MVCRTTIFLQLRFNLIVWCLNTLEHYNFEFESKCTSSRKGRRRDVDPVPNIKINHENFAFLC